MRNVLLFGFRWPLAALAAVCIAAGAASVFQWDLALMGGAVLAVLSQVFAGFASHYRKTEYVSVDEAVDEVEDAILKHRFMILAEAKDDESSKAA